jgi:hypothetical protein
MGEIMNIEKNLRDRMIEKARELYGDISYIAHLDSIEDSFTEVDGDLLFWFNIENNSTRVVSHKYHICT